MSEVEAAMDKLAAGWLEKMSVAGMAVGLFQGQIFGIVLGVVCFLGSAYLIRKGGG
jgi:hypothetical protein